MKSKMGGGEGSIPIEGLVKDGDVVIITRKSEKVEEHHRKRHEIGDALVKNCKPINYHYGTPPKCRHIERISMYSTWECKHPEVRDSHEYKDCCTDLDWKICPLKAEKKNVVCEIGKEVKDKVLFSTTGDVFALKKGRLVKCQPFVEYTENPWEAKEE